MSPKRKGQMAIEFIMMMAAAIIVGSLFLYSAYGLLADRTEEERITALNDLGYAIQDELILAQTVSDGYERTFTVPTLAGRFTYALTSLPGAVTLQSGRTTITYPTPAFTGVIAKGANTIAKDGAITVTQ